MSSLLAEAAAPSYARAPRVSWLARVFALSPGAAMLLERAAAGERPLRAAPEHAADVHELVSHGLAVGVASLALAPRIQRYVDDDDRIISPLDAFVTVRVPGRGDGDAHPAIVESLSRLAAEGVATGQAVAVHLHGPTGVGRRRTAGAVAAALGVPLLVADLERAPQGFEFGEVLLEAWLRDAVLFVRGIDWLLSRGRDDDAHRVLTTLRADRGISVIASEHHLAVAELTPDFVFVELGVPNATRRRVLWDRALGDVGLSLDGVDAALMADRFALTPAQIDAAAADARGRVRWARARGEPVSTRAATLAAARARSGNELGELATLVDVHRSWDDLVLPADSIAQLRELHDRVAARRIVLDDWGFSAKLQYGLSPTALFFGPSGTGKTMAAAVLARTLELELYRVNLSGVVSKYIGETEKNLDRVFDAADRSNAVLLFDEADALFGKRSEVKDAHDRYANVEISYLLQRMETYDGIAILATNLRGHLDEAFTRRIAFLVHFPLPDVALREAIWRRVWPSAALVDGELDAARLARAFPLSGGNIKNVALAAAFAAASDGSSPSTIGVRHVLHAIRREYAKMGKDIDPAELNETLRAAALRGH